MKKANACSFPLDWAVCFGAVFAATRCLQSSFELPVDGSLWLWLLAICGALCLVFRMERTWIWALGSFVLLAAAAWWLRGPLWRNLNDLASVIGYHVEMAYSETPPTFVLPEPIPDLLPALLVLGTVLAFLLCLSTVWLRTVIPSVLWCILTVTPCFLIVSKAPEGVWLLLLCACMLLWIFTHGTRVLAPAELPRAALFALLPVALTLGLLLLCFPEDTYAPPITISQISDGMKELGDQLNVAFTGQTRTPQGVDLRRLGAKPQVSGKVMDVKVGRELGEYLYLRGTAYEVFDGNGWRLPDTVPAWDGEGTPLDRGKINATAVTASVLVNTVRVEAVLYTPQNLQQVNGETVYDYYVPNGDRLRNYVYYMNIPTTRTVLEDKIIARSWLPEQNRAERDCLYLPEETKTALLELAEANGLTDAYWQYDRQGQIRAIADFVRNRADYELAPGTVPEGEDFCTWFLKENRKGYCIHFATAAAAMYRAVGIPSRYVEGYLVKTVPGVTVDVDRMQAHAWVEVCVNDSWDRVDPTPAEGQEQTVLAGQSEDATETSESLRETETTDETAPVRPTEPTDPTEATGETETAPVQPERAAKRGAAWWWLLALPALALPPLLRLLRRRTRAARRAHLRGNERALWDYRRYARLCAACKAEPEAGLSALAMKARFSQHALTQAELDALAAGAVRQEAFVRALPLGKRLWYGWLLL